jgi:sec-independent protein translocase protein TatA
MDILSPVHLIIVLVIALLIFGPRRLPEIGSGLGKTIREFKGALNGTVEGTVEKTSPDDKPQ